MTKLSQFKVILLLKFKRQCAYTQAHISEMLKLTVSSHYSVQLWGKQHNTNKIELQYYTISVRLHFIVLDLVVVSRNNVTVCGLICREFKGALVLACM